MNGIIKSIKLCHTEEGAYWDLTIVDENDIEIGRFGNAKKDDASSFREQTFGLMKILDNYNLFNLGCQDLAFPILVKVYNVFHKSIANLNGDYFTVDGDANMSFGKKEDLSDYQDAVLDTLESRSGILASRINGAFSYQYFQFPAVYLGFRTLYDNVSVGKEQELYGAQCFMDTVCNVMKVCGFDDLLLQQDSPIIYPTVSLELDNDGKITAIGSSDKSCWLVDGDVGYSISRSSDEDTSRKMK